MFASGAASNAVGSTERSATPVAASRAKHAAALRASAPYQSSVALYHRTQVDVLYGPLLTSLSSREQVRFEDELFAWNDAPRQASERVAHGPQLDPRLEPVYTRALRDAIRTQMTRTVGATGFEAFEVYKPVAALGAVIELQQYLAATGDELSAVQRAKLIHALASVPPAATDNGIGLVPMAPDEPVATIGGDRFIRTATGSAYVDARGNLYADVTIPNTLIRSASAYLDPAQLQALQTVQTLVQESHDVWRGLLDWAAEQPGATAPSESARLYAPAERHHLIRLEAAELAKLYAPLLAGLKGGPAVAERLLESLAASTVGGTGGATAPTSKAKLEALLGPLGYAALRHFDQSLPAWKVCLELNNVLAARGLALTPAQSDALVRLIERTSHGTAPPRQLGLTAAERFEAKPYGEARLTPATVDAARTILSAPQVAVLSRIEQQQSLAAAVGLLARN